ncbi:MAG: hypothetical protein U5L45_14140 [Saprospiraceae bacterium]|nr:hypothetical protein [Saprospiraceae bacterium]
MLAQRQEQRWFIFRLRRKMNHIHLFARAKRADDLESLKRYYNLAFYAFFK